MTGFFHFPPFDSLAEAFVKAEGKDAITAAQRAYADTGAMPELLSIYHLFGDPGMKIRFPQ